MISVNINMSMLMSYAWQTMSYGQGVLYLYCKTQCCRNSINRSEDDPENNQGCFEFPEYLWIKKDEKHGTTAAPAETYNLYSDKESFYRDIAVLIDHGFIDCVRRGSGFGKKTLYRLSERWRNYGQPGYLVPDEVKTIAMRGAQNNLKARC